MAQTRTVRQRVARGVAYLDKTQPGWFKKINLKNFEISNTCQCIIGQVFKRHKPTDTNGWDSPFSTGVKRLALTEHQLTIYGFDRDCDCDGYDDYEVLQKYWLLALEEKLRANKTAKPKTTSK